MSCATMALVLTLMADVQSYVYCSHCHLYVKVLKVRSLLAYQQ